LLETAERELVEVRKASSQTRGQTENSSINKTSPFDKIWGIGFDAENAANHKKDWGENLLGKALMNVRARLKNQLTN